MKTQISIVSANPGVSGVEVVFARNSSQELESAIVSGEVFSNVLKAANLPNIPATYRNINGAIALVEVVDAKAGETFINRDGSMGTYSRNHIRLNSLSIINGATIYGKLSLDEVAKDNALFAAQTVSFERKNPVSAIKANLLGSSKPATTDSVPATTDSVPEVVDASLDIAKPAAKPSAKALEAAQ